MIITKIEIENFMCYAGSNKFEFTEGINVIIGDNGYGKSKLFDAFYWALYDQCYETSKKEFVGTGILQERILSDKAIFDAEDGDITASVKITFQNTDKDSVYILERYYTVNKDNNNITPNNLSYEVILEKSLSYLNAVEVRDPSRIESIKKSILPDNIKPYMWFQGEQVESIIDFNKQDTLTQAINVLSNISKFDSIIETADSLHSSVLREHRKKERDLSGDKAKSDAYEIDRENLVKKISDLERQNLQIKDNIAISEEHTERIINKLEAAERIRLIEEKRKSLIKDLQEIQDELQEEQVIFHKRMFTDKWVLKGTEALVVNYNKKYDEYNKIKLANHQRLELHLEAENGLLKEMQTRLPIDVPEPIHVERMLEEEKCLVCDREAPKDSEAWLKMKELIERSMLRIKDLDEEKAKLVINDFESEFKKLYQIGLSNSHNIKNIEHDIKSLFRRIARLDKKRKSREESLSKLESELNSLIVDTQLTPSEAENILNSLSSQKEIESRSNRELGSNEASVKEKKRLLEEIDKTLSSLVTGEIPKFLKEKLEALTDFKEIAHSTRKRVFDNLVNRLQDEANKHYKSMTMGNMSARGVIRLKELSNGKNYMPELIDENGNVLHQLNTGNIILIKLSTIMAIISAKQGSRTTDLYTLITDAPMSVFGEDYTVGFCKTVSQVYRQSIIMSKEFYRNLELRRQLLNNEEIKLGKVYLITPNISEDERANRNTLATTIQALN